MPPKRKRTTKSDSITVDKAKKLSVPQLKKELKKLGLDTTGLKKVLFARLSAALLSASDSGSLVIDILAANGVEEPPVIQRIFWACMEGLTATALLIAGGSNALNALSTVSIVAGLPYTALLCFICTST